MYMKTLQLSVKNVVLAVISLWVIFLVGYFVLNIMSGIALVKARRGVLMDTPVLSADKKVVTVDDKNILSVDNSKIFEWFQSKSGLCDGDNKVSTPERKAFCENKDEFVKSARFGSVILSPDKSNIGFTVESDTLAPDKVVGIFSRANNLITMVSGYYLGNEFIAFSPKGVSFVYKSGCFEGNCVLIVANTETFAQKISVSDSAYADARTKDVVFVKWISENSLEYLLGGELKRVSF